MSKFENPVTQAEAAKSAIASAEPKALDAYSGSPTQGLAANQVMNSEALAAKAEAQRA